MNYHPSFHAKTNPEKPAVIMSGSGEVVTYGELEAQSNRFAQLLRSRGIGIGDTIALCFENHPVFFSLCWGAQRAGIVYVAISSRLAPPEVAYIARDSGAKLLVGSGVLTPLLDAVAAA